VEIDEGVPKPSRAAHKHHRALGLTLTRIGKAKKMPKNRDQGIGLNGSVKNRIVAVFIEAHRVEIDKGVSKPSGATHHQHHRGVNPY